MLSSNGKMQQNIVKFRQAWIAKLVLLLFCLVPQAALSNPVSNQTTLSPVWQSVYDNLPADKGTFNAALRKSVREQLNLPDIKQTQLDKKQLLEILKPRLTELDKALSRYIRVSESATNYQQLKRLMPALVKIEEIKLIKRLLKQHKVRAPNLRNSRLLPFLDKRINLLANGMIFNMKALVRQRRDYEPDLLQAMASYGVKFSARPPDFILDYQLVSSGKNEQGEWVFDGSIALLGKYQVPVVKLEEMVISAAATEAEAQSRSVAVLAKLITMQLKQYLIEQTNGD